MSHAILKALGLSDVNSGTYLGRGEWSSASAGRITPKNPTTNEVIATVEATTAADYETVIARAGGFQDLAHHPAPRRSRPSACAARRCAATRTRWARWWRWKWASQARRRRRSAGDDRHRRFRRRPEPHDVRLYHALERPGHRMYDQYHPLGRSASSAPSTSPWRCGAGTASGRGVRRHLHLEAIQQGAAECDRGHEGLQRGAARGRLPGPLLPDQRCRPFARRNAGGRSPRGSHFLHRLDPRGPPRERARGAPHGPLPAGAGRQQRDHPR